MAGYWPSSVFVCLWTETKSRSINTQKKRTRPISSHLDRTSLVNKGFIIWDKTTKHDKFSLRDKAHIQSGQDSSTLPAQVANHSTRFGSSCPLTELVILIINNVISSLKNWVQAFVANLLHCLHVGILTCIQSFHRMCELNCFQILPLYTNQNQSTLHAL